ncbi:discoidin domain-containing protein [Paenibacillus eucommiae]|uniref:Chitodextrinase n=1 Tax=Paenibacillus eucommiae TaxID=1355755 RepID=A0ABS4J3S2_9BACL|nr:discoidin domain-containing protein [Paenibacillus eucommiae]MBP1994494.1 chitodextrinase [Paenibacillus eucommiae]
MRKKLIYLLVFSLFIELCSAFFVGQPEARASSGVDIYVAPNGAGTICEVSVPCSLEAGRDKVRTLNENMSSDIIVLLRGGTYTLNEPFELFSADSGSNGFDIYYKAYPGETPVISGGAVITGWELHDTAANIYRAPAAASLETRQLYVNGHRAVRAKGGELPGAQKTATGYTTTDLTIKDWGNVGDIELVFRKLWTESRCSVAAITDGTITVDEPCFTMVNNTRSVQAGNPTWIENAYELLGEAGEWYLDRTGHFIYYKPLTGEDMSTAEVIAPVLETLVKGTGTLEQPLEHVVFEGLTFSHGTWLQPNTEYGFRDIQAGFMSPNEPPPVAYSYTDVKMPASVTISGGRNIHFERNTFVHLGAVGLNIDYGAQDNLIQGNIFRDISGNAIMLGDVKQEDYHPSVEVRAVDRNTIKNNFITQAGAEYHDSVGIWTGYTRNTVIAHNEITDLPYSGISIGWGWGETDEGGSIGYTIPTIVENNKIINNKIWNTMHTLIDGAGIYSLSADRNQLISGNVISDVHTHGAIYLDNKSRYNTIINNVSFDIAGSNHLFLNDNKGNTLFSYNFWDQSAKLYDNSKNGVFLSNQVVEDPLTLPASIINNAGLEQAYQDLNPRVIPADTEAPDAPAAFSLAETDTAVTDNSVTLQWSASADNTAVTGYEIKRDDIVVGVTTDTTFTVRNLQPGQSYVFTVAARDAACNLSSANPSLTVETTNQSILDNLAYNKQVTVQYDSPEGREADMHPSRDPENAVDGDPATYAVSIHEYAWQQQVDLGSVQNINRVVVKMDPAYYASKYDIRISDDGINFTTIKSVVGFTGGTSEESFDDSEARFVRIVAVKPDGANQPGNQMVIYELEIYNDLQDEPSELNLALNKPARAFYIGGDNITTKTMGYEAIVDDDPTTCAQVPRATVWKAAVDLGFATDFNQIKVVMPLTAYATDFKIEVSENGSNYSVVSEVADFEGGSYTTYSPQNARYVRVVATAPVNPLEGKQMAIAEIAVYNTSNLALEQSAQALQDDGTDAAMLQGHEAAKANDGNPATSARSVGQDPWHWNLDLGAVHNMNQIRLLLDEISDPLNNVDMKISTSVDGVDFTDIEEVTAFGGGWKTIRFEDRNAQYIRVAISFTSDTPAFNAKLALNEVEVYHENVVEVNQKTTDSTDADRFYYQKVSSQEYVFKAGDVLEYEFMLLSDAAAIGGIDIVTADGKRLKDQGGWYDQWHISGNPASDLSGQGQNQWLKRTMKVSSAMQGRSASAWLLAMENDLALTELGVKYRNLLIRNAYGQVAVRISMDDSIPVEDGYIQGYELDTSVKLVQLNESSLDLLIGDTATMVASVIPAYATNKQVVWTSSHPDVASIDQEGVVHANQAGTAVITAASVDGGYSDTAEITVRFHTTRSGNYALNRPAKAYTSGGADSTTHPGSEADKANDGDINTFAASNMVFAWNWEVDLEEVRQISLIQGHMHEANYATEFEIAGSVDGQSYETIAHIQNFTGGSFASRIPAADFRYIQIRAIKPDGPGQAGSMMLLNEVEVYMETPIDPTITPTNASFDKNIAHAADLELSLFLNGQTLTSIANGEDELTLNVDYTINGDVVTLKKQYLSSLTGSEVPLFFRFSAGPARSFTVAITDSTPGSRPEPHVESPSPSPVPSPGPKQETNGEEVKQPTEQSPNAVKDNPKGGTLKDVPAAHWAAAAIARALERGIVNGYPDGTFRPNAAITRAEFVTLLMRALKLEAESGAKVEPKSELEPKSESDAKPESGPKKLTFTDSSIIPEWARHSVALAVDAGIIDGYSDGKFYPNNKIIRSEMAAILTKALKLPITEPYALTFADKDLIPLWAVPYVATVFKAGLMQGRDNHLFAPLAEATRAEAVFLLDQGVVR